MAGLSVIGLRDMAREAMLSCGARGFVRFVREDAEGCALLVTDAASRCEDGGKALCAALERAGFVCEPAGRLLLITPGDALLEQLCAPRGERTIDWESPLHEAQALAARLMRETPAPLTPSGRALVMHVARTLWQAEDKALVGLTAVRGLIAARLREGDRNGFYQAGCLLMNGCHRYRKGDKGP